MGLGGSWVGLCQLSWASTRGPALSSYAQKGVGLALLLTTVSKGQNYISFPLKFLIPETDSTIHQHTETPTLESLTPSWTLLCLSLRTVVLDSRVSPAHLSFFLSHSPFSEASLGLCHLEYHWPHPHPHYPCSAKLKHFTHHLKIPWVPLAFRIKFKLCNDLWDCCLAHKDPHLNINIPYLITNVTLNEPWNLSNCVSLSLMCSL